MKEIIEKTISGSFKVISIGAQRKAGVGIALANTPSCTWCQDSGSPSGGPQSSTLYKSFGMSYRTCHHSTFPPKLAARIPSLPRMAYSPSRCPPSRAQFEVQAARVVLLVNGWVRTHMVLLHLGHVACSGRKATTGSLEYQAFLRFLLGRVVGGLPFSSLPPIIFYCGKIQRT